MTRIPDDCTVRLLDLPPGVHGFICMSPDGHSNIYINARDSRARQRRALDHELTHFVRGDLDSAEPVRVIEARVSRRRAVRIPAIPQLVKARDLLPKPAPAPAAPVLLTAYQARALRECFSELDRFLFEDPFRGAL